jgi:transposase
MAREARAPVRVKSINRKQMLLRSIDVEKLVEEDHPVRAIWEMVGQLDLSAIYERIEAVEGKAGQSAHDPRLLMSLWIYAYSEGVSSAREVSRLCQYHPGYQWLTAMGSINYHSLSDFRVRYAAELDELFTQVLGILSAEGLIGLKRVMQDGTKVKACAGIDTFCGEKALGKHLEMAGEQVRLLSDPASQELSQRVARARQRAVREKQQRLGHAVEELKQQQAKRSKKDKEVRVSTSDPECRIMKDGQGGYAPSYNLQVMTDGQEKVIVGVRVSQEAGDVHELASGIQQVAERSGGSCQQVVTDGAYTSYENLVMMGEAEVDWYSGLSKAMKGEGSSGTQNLPVSVFQWEPALCLSCRGTSGVSQEGEKERADQTSLSLSVECLSAVSVEAPMLSPGAQPRAYDRAHRI